MRFVETPLAGAFVIEPEVSEDERGAFARTYCEREFLEHGLDARIAQCNLSFNLKAGTLRGMHYQADPHAEVKLVRCVRGAVHDVIVDLRPGSPTLRAWFEVRLDAASRRMLYVPKGFAHGFLTLVDETEVFYQMSSFYEPTAARGLRWDDPLLGIRWPIAAPILSARDRNHPLLAEI